MAKGLALALVTGALVALGCGGGDEGSAEDDFASQADQICTDFVKQRIAAEQPPPTAPPEAHLETVEEANRQRQDAVDRLGELDPPAESADAYEAFIAAREDAIATAEEEAKLIEEGTTPEEPPYQRVLSEFDEHSDSAEEAAAEAGLVACAQQLPTEVQNEVKAAVEEFETQPLDDCTELTTDEGIEVLFGNLEKCQKAQENPPPEGFTEAVEFVDEVQGIENLTASAEVKLEGGPNDGATVEYSLLYEDGTYKVDNVSLAPET